MAELTLPIDHEQELLGSYCYTEEQLQDQAGMFARGEVVTGALKNVLLISKDAIDERKGTQSVFTVKPDGTVKRHIVEVIRENRNYVEIQSPNDLNAGDTVVTQGRQNLQEGTKVHVRIRGFRDLGI